MIEVDCTVVVLSEGQQKKTINLKRWTSIYLIMMVASKASMNEIKKKMGPASSYSGVVILRPYTKMRPAST